MLIVGGANSSGTSRTFGVCGAYWMSSKTSVRRTTEPGREREVLADREPARVDGRRAGCGKSPAKRRAPRTRFRPPWSTVCLDDRGVRPREVASARARRATLPAAKRAWRSARQSRPASEIRPSTVSLDREVGLQQRAGTASSSPTPDRRSGGRACPGAAPSARRRPASARAPRPAARRAARSGRRARPAATLDGGAGADEPRAAVGRRVGEHHVERGARRLGRPGACASLRWSSAPHLHSVSSGHVSESRRARGAVSSAAGSPRSRPVL